MIFISCGYSDKNLDLERDDNYHCCTYVVNKEGVRDHRNVG